MLIGHSIKQIFFINHAVTFSDNHSHHLDMSGCWALVKPAPNRLYNAGRWYCLDPRVTWNSARELTPRNYDLKSTTCGVRDLTWFDLTYYIYDLKPRFEIIFKG